MQPLINMTPLEEFDAENLALIIHQLLFHRELKVSVLSERVGVPETMILKYADRINDHFISGMFQIKRNEGIGFSLYTNNEKRIQLHELISDGKFKQVYAKKLKELEKNAREEEISKETLKNLKVTTFSSKHTVITSWIAIGISIMALVIAIFTFVFRKG